MAENQTTMIVVVGIVGCCCVLSIAVAAYFYLNPDKWDWFLGLFGLGNDEEPAGGDTGAESTGDTSGAVPADTSGAVPADTSGAVPADTSGTDTTADTGGSGGGKNCEDKGDCPNKMGQFHICRNALYLNVKYDKKGKSVKCCKNKSSKFNSGDCKSEYVQALPKGVKKNVVDKVHEQMKNYKTKLFGNPVSSYTCPCAAGSDSFVKNQSVVIRLNEKGKWMQKCVNHSTAKVRTCVPKCDKDWKVGPDGKFCRDKWKGARNIKWDWVNN